MHYFEIYLSLSLSLSLCNLHQKHEKLLIYVFQNFIVEDRQIMQEWGNWFSQF